MKTFNDPFQFGVTPFVSRDKIIPFSETIPDITESGKDWIPCNDANMDGKITTQQKLSCMAKENEIYVVANMVDYKVG